MMVPDTAIIVKVLLYTSGFTNAPSLAVKLTKLYQMAEMQLSHQVIRLNNWTTVDQEIFTFQFLQLVSVVKLL